VPLGSGDETRYAVRLIGIRESLVRSELVVGAHAATISLTHAAGRNASAGVASNAAAPGRAPRRGSRRGRRLPASQVGHDRDAGLLEEPVSDVALAVARPKPTPRVRDGCISESTSGHGRSYPTRA